MAREKRFVLASSPTHGMIRWDFSDALNEALDGLSPEDDEKLLTCLEELFPPLIQLLTFYLHGPEFNDGETMEQLVDMVKDFALRTFARHNN